MFRYTDHGSYYEVEAVFYRNMRWHAEGEDIPIANAMDRASITSARRLLFTIRKNDDGTLTFESMQYLPTDDQAPA